MKKTIQIVLFSLLLIGGLLLRTIGLTRVPAGFFCDEAAIGYNAYTLLHTGADEYGKPFPLFFQSFGDYKDPVQIYTTIPYVALLGLSEVSTRLPSVVWGMLLLIVLYFLGKQIHSPVAGWGSAIAGATMPWLIHYNRIGFELNAYVFFFSLTVLFFLKAVQRKSWLIPAWIAAGITAYTYQPAKLLVPLLLVGIIIIYWKKLRGAKSFFIIGVLVFFALILPLLASFFTPEATARFVMVSVFSAKLSLSQTLFKIASNYFFQLSPQFFLVGEPTFITRHFTNGLLPLLPITIPLLCLGLLEVLFTCTKKESQLLLWWLLLYPIGGAVVAEAPFTNRAVIGAPFFALLIGIGLALVFKHSRHLHSKILIGFIMSVLFALNLTIFCQFYFKVYPLISSDFWGWQFGAKDIVGYFATHEANYDDEVMQGEFNEPEIFLKFYAPTQCKKCQIGDPESLYNPKRKQLFALTPEYIGKHSEFHYSIVKNILYPNATTAFYLVTVKK
ncbi:MAG TPA: glycosyltransferase family 39 protein [Patescibacteria group bacterium]|nr:glycosyltransferase family 39 protein [Patescibacteria group bacterium]